MVIMDDMMNKFLDYADFDEDGNLIGIKKEAPEEAVNAYKEFVRIQEEASAAGVDI